MRKPRIDACNCPRCSFGTGVVSPPLAADSPSTGGASNTVDPLAQAEDSTGDNSAEPATPVADDSPSRNSAAPTAPAGGDPPTDGTPAAALGTDDSSSADNAPGGRRSFRFARGASTDESTESTETDTTSTAIIPDDASSPATVITRTTAYSVSQQTSQIASQNATSEFRGKRDGYQHCFGPSNRGGGRQTQRDRRLFF